MNLNKGSIVKILYFGGGLIFLVHFIASLNVLHVNPCRVILCGSQFLDTLGF